jgi:formylglycine-generating enzyme required for sulfatase activity
VEYLRNRAGLLMPRGVGVHTFPHRTFQEYLAACHLTDHEFPDQVAELARRDPNRWREVALLAGAKAARGSAATVWQLAEALCFREPEAGERGPADEWGAHLAGQLLVESADLTSVSERHRPKLDRVRRWLVEVLGSRELPALERAEAGKILARLGDPRFSAEHWHLPTGPLLGFVEVPAGRFVLGSDKKKDPQADEDELPQHELELPGYFIGRYPVTVGQFRAFVESSGYEPGDRDSLRGVSNEPVVWVSWHEAQAYCGWLGERLREVAAARLEAAQDEAARRFWGGLVRGELGVGLPSEAEWEKAARGEDGRVFPWGDDPDPNRANYHDTGLGEASPVGCFPGGASPYGCEEMSGNVWEWTRSLWGKDWQKADFGYPYNPLDGRESLEASDVVRRVLRGGAFYSNQGSVRCAVRNGSHPSSRYRRLGFRVLLSPLL